MTLPDVLSTLREQRAEHARELEAIDGAIRLLETAATPARRAAAANAAKPEPKPAPRKASGPKPAPKQTPKAATKAQPEPAAKPKTEPPAVRPHEPLPSHHGRIPYGKNVQRLDVATKDQAISTARSFLERGYKRRLGQSGIGKPSLEPGTFNVLPVGDGFAVVWIELPGEDRIAAKEAA